MKPELIKLKIAFYKEGEQFISYCPALDLSTAGDTFEEAKKNFEEAADIFFEETIKRGTLEDVLLECGWEKIKRPRLHWKPPARRFITEIEEEVSMPCPR
jgi:predicted RNase H-like HicB family nuclease